MMRIHQMQPLKEGLISLTANPGTSLIEDSIGCRIGTKTFHCFLPSTRQPLAIQEIEFFISRRRPFVSSGISFEKAVETCEMRIHLAFRRSAVTGQVLRKEVPEGVKPFVIATTLAEVRLSGEVWRCRTPACCQGGCRRRCCGLGPENSPASS